LIRKESILDSLRVTAGLPSVDPLLRTQRDRQAAQRQYQDALHAEAQTKAKAAVAPDGSIDRTKREAARGIELTGDIIVARLTQLVPNLHFERSKADPKQMGVYVHTGDPEQPLEFVGGFTYERCAEFMNVHTEERMVRDRNGVPQKEEVCKGITPGWRELTWRLIKRRLVSPERIAVVFGPPSRDSRNWYLAMNT